MVNSSVCAVVVTYNRKELLWECLESLKYQSKHLDAIYIVDNASIDDTPQFLKEKGYLTEIPQSFDKSWEKDFVIKNNLKGNDLIIHYYRSNRNLGGTGGFYEGIKRSYEKGYEWLWIMDDDAEPKKNALLKLFEYTSENAVSAVANLVLDTNNEIQLYHNANLNFSSYISFVSTLKISDFDNKVLKIDMSSFVGILISKKCIEKVGFPKKELFIYEDDIEYSIRLKTCGKILLVTDSVIIHKAKHKKNEIRKFFNRNYNKIPIKDYWRVYFGLRNYVWIRKKYLINKRVLYLNIIWSYIKQFFGIILFDNNKRIRLRILTEAYVDGLKGNFDNNKPYQILNN